jgi:hypothetical protein
MLNLFGMGPVGSFVVKVLSKGFKLIQFLFFVFFFYKLIQFHSKVENVFIFFISMCIGGKYTTRVTCLEA